MSNCMDASARWDIPPLYQEGRGEKEKSGIPRVDSGGHWSPRRKQDSSSRCGLQMPGDGFLTAHAAHGHAAFGFLWLWRGTGQGRSIHQRASVPVGWTVCSRLRHGPGTVKLGLVLGSLCLVLCASFFVL